MKKTGPLTPEEQMEILSRIWDETADPGDGGWVFLPWIPGQATREERRNNWNEGKAFEWPQDRDKILNHLKLHQDDELYFSVNRFTAESRIKECTGEGITLFADLDEVDPREIPRSIRPTIAWETSPGRYQGVWIMSSMMWESCEPGGYNHRLTTHIGADNSGWDATQVLRVPGKPNFKPEYRDANEGKPVEGRLLWNNDKIFQWEEIDAKIPNLEVTEAEAAAIEDAEIDSIDRRMVWNRVRMKVSPLVRKYMTTKRREAELHDDRSGVLWQIGRDLADAGCTVTEIVAILRASAWNKYAGQKRELAQLKSEAIKVKAISIQESKEETLEIVDETLPNDLIFIDDILRKGIPKPSWLIRNIWAKGSCGFIAGQPKSYKSYFALDMALSIATGKPFLNDSQFSTGEPRKVIYIQEEDPVSVVMKRIEQIIDEKSPEHHWWGAMDVSPNDTLTDAQRVCWTPATTLHTLALMVRHGFVASDPVWQSWLLEKVQDWGADMVIIDTLGTTAGDVDTDKSSIMNPKILRPLKIISESADCAIAIVHHNRKNEDSNGRSGQSMLGSVAMHAWVESALYVRSKEQVTGQPAEVKIERENKLAEDMKFRVRIPRMWYESGDQADGARQLWSPTVYTGWSETNDTENEVTSSSAGKLIVSFIKQDMGDGCFTVDQIAQAYGRPIRSTAKQLRHAVANDLLFFNFSEKTYSLARARP